MENVDYPYEIKKLKTVSWITSGGTLLSFFVFIQSINGNPSVWRVICATLGFLSIATMTAFVFWRLKQVQREGKN